MRRSGLRSWRAAIAAAALLVLSGALGESFHQNGETVVQVDQDQARNWSLDNTQACVCDAIGKVLGLADNPANDVNTPDDCIKAGGGESIDPEGIDAVLGFFGYPEVDGFGGQAYERRNNLLTTGVYPVNPCGAGHGLTRVALYVDAVDAAHMLGAPSPASSCGSQTTAGADNCWQQVTRDVGPLSAGTHTIYAKATNEFGQSSTRSFTVTVREPSLDWGFNEA